MDDEPGAMQDIIVVGASAGGVDALMRFADGVPRGAPVVTLIVLHFPRLGDSNLPGILRRQGHPFVWHARDGQPLRTGEMVVGPPGLHLVVESARARLLADRKPIGPCPAIDPLFRTAAWSFGSRVAAVVLSGVCDDGSAGAAAVAAAGGAVFVQDPADARFPGMPRSALAAVDRAAVGSAGELGARLGGVVAPRAGRRRRVIARHPLLWATVSWHGQRERPRQR
jgi:two-component system chemotaxis response regulator CheB